MSTEINIYEGPHPNWGNNSTNELKYRAAVMLAVADNQDLVVQVKSGDEFEWSDMDHPGPGWNWLDNDYRIHPKHKPKPKMITVPRTLEDFTDWPVIWVTNDDCVVLVSEIGLSNGQIGVPYLVFGGIKRYLKDDFPYVLSPDRKNWVPWFKEVEAEG